MRNSSKVSPSLNSSSVSSTQGSTKSGSKNDFEVETAVTEIPERPIKVKRVTSKLTCPISSNCFLGCCCWCLRFRNVSPEGRMRKISYCYTLTNLVFIFFLLIFCESFWSSNFSNAGVYFLYSMLALCAIPTFWVLQLETLITSALLVFFIFFSIITVFVIPYVVENSPRGIFNNIHVQLMFLIPTFVISFQNSFVVQTVFYCAFGILLLSSFIVDMILDSPKIVFNPLSTRLDIVLFYLFPYLFITIVFFSKLKLYRHPKHGIRKKNLKTLKFIRDLVVRMKTESKRINKLMETDDRKSSKEDNLIKDIIFHLREYKGYLPKHLFDQVIVKKEKQLSSKSKQTKMKMRRTSTSSITSVDSMDSDYENNGDLRKMNSHRSMRSTSTCSSHGGSTEDLENFKRFGIRRTRSVTGSSRSSSGGSGNGSVVSAEDSKKYMSIQNSGIDLVSTEQTLLMVKLEGFDKHLSDLTEEEFLFYHTTVLTEIQDILEKNGGYVHTFFNDVVYASFNSPVRRCVTHEVTAVRSAVEIQRQMRTAGRTKSIRKCIGVVPTFTVAVFSGVSHVGNMGCDSLRRYTHVGRSMRILKSMVDLGYGTRILINGKAWAKAKFYFDCKRFDLAVFGRTTGGGGSFRRAKMNRAESSDSSEEATTVVGGLHRANTSEENLNNSSLTNSIKEDVVIELFSVRRRKRKRKRVSSSYSSSLDNNDGVKKSSKQNEWYDEVEENLQEETDEDCLKNVWECYIRGMHEKGLEFADEFKRKFFGDSEVSGSLKPLPEEISRVYKRMEEGKTLAIQLQNKFDLVDIYPRKKGLKAGNSVVYDGV